MAAQRVAASARPKLFTKSMVRQNAGGRCDINEDLVAIVAALEVIAMTALGLHLAKARHAAEDKKAGVLLATMRDALKTKAAMLPAEAQKHAIDYGNHLLDAVEKRYGRMAGRVAN